MTLKSAYKYVEQEMVENIATTDGQDGLSRNGNLLFGDLLCMISMKRNLIQLCNVTFF